MHGAKRFEKQEDLNSARIQQMRDEEQTWNWLKGETELTTVMLKKYQLFEALEESEEESEKEAKDDRWSIERTRVRAIFSTHHIAATAQIVR